MAASFAIAWSHRQIQIFSIICLII
jgi:hypothetical protein